MCDKAADERILTLRIVPHSGDRVKLIVEDTGCGIQSRNLTSIFTQGFTTKKDGHGFGLHHACLLAQDMAGSLSAESDGLGHGARFILDLPVRDAPTRPPSGPMSGPLSGPLTGPLSGPLTGPLSGPLKGPHPGPMSGPLTRPLSGPMHKLLQASSQTVTKSSL